MKKFLQKIFVLQVVSNKGKNPKLGRGFTKAYRLNPWNPLSYITFILFWIIGILMFGFVGVWKKVETRNPFKWN